MTKVEKLKNRLQLIVDGKSSPQQRSGFTRSVKSLNQGEAQEFLIWWNIKKTTGSVSEEQKFRAIVPSVYVILEQKALQPVNG